ncbi:MAG TPA: pyridoxal phosphate-dependent aminotransferase [Candidatus Limnocylindrales bacterium]|nr:pyridoxal phosphate-dependent aminotransferase [Candidatus Limnocylindrales bacterium]
MPDPRVWPMYADVLGDGDLPNGYGDSAILRHYRRLGGDPEQIIYLSLGETWTQAAPGLVAALSGPLPQHCHGYILAPHGLPDLHRVLREYVARTHLLDGFRPGRDYEVCVAQSGTRNSMYDFGRLLLTDQAGAAGAARVLIPDPGWDYAGVFEPLGFEVWHYPLAAADSYQPRPQLVAQQLAHARADDPDGVLLVVVNPQHNPTGANWTEPVVRQLVEAAFAANAAVLLDDAYFGMHDPHAWPTCGLRVLLETAGPSSQWLAVRSLGKQFHCNGWGIGAVTGPPATVAAMVNRMLHQRAFVSSVPLQAAMAAWLRSHDSDAYLAITNRQYAVKRRLVADWLDTKLAYPTGAYYAGTCTPYIRMRVPPAYEHTGVRPDEADPQARYRWDCLTRAGVLLGAGSMTAPALRADPHAYVRFYLGHPQPVVEQALDRLAAAGLTWHATPVSPNGTGMDLDLRMEAENGSGSLPDRSAAG